MFFPACWNSPLAEKMAVKMKKNEDRKIPDNFDYDKINSFSAETKSRLNSVRPETLGQASRITGIKPSDIAILTVYLEKRRKENKKAVSAHGKQ
ncbi:MAG: hypothetical protein LBR47_06805 [Spirochaetaceae bacterium]|jgi:tRNA uridine 5-carboxymethylaminomethyl modification enzyme|nr:hypothetical protein [Spirochaetaceae bacterium]